MKSSNKKTVMALLTGDIEFDPKLAKSVSVPSEHLQAWSNFIEIMSPPFSDRPVKDLTPTDKNRLKIISCRNLSNKLMLWAFE